MKASASPSATLPGLPIASSQGQGWENIVIEQFQTPPGEGTCYYNDEHIICLSLAPRPIRMVQVQNGKTHAGLYGKGDISIAPAQTPFFARWDGEDHYLQMRIPSQFVHKIAQETFNKNLREVELLSEFQTRDPHIESVGLLLLAELSDQKAGSKLYIDSLSNVLGIHLIRQYTAAKPRPSLHSGGLTERQLRQVLDYIHDHLDQEIKLLDLSQLLGISQFHFSHLFKQSMGKAPYQYLLHQRIERAKQLLQNTDQTIMDIAYRSGFNSHSHLSKQFRQITGMTPKAYRTISH